MNVFVTFYSKGYEAARDRICHEAEQSGKFDKVITINDDDLTDELKQSETFHVKKGFGLYSWKPDTIYLALKQLEYGDNLVYLDAGCKINSNRQWDKLFDYLEKCDIIGFLLHQRNYMWTRKSVFDHFSKDIDLNWKEGFQFGANALVLKKTELSVKFIKEWRDYMINRLDLCGDVAEDDISHEDPRLIENRYDQTILTALLYKYYSTGKVKDVWEHFEGYDFFRSQAFMAARMRTADSENRSLSMSFIVHGFIKQYIYYPIIGNYIRKKIFNS